eukprot:TRINITY_DN1999_c0_g1_i1.p1 TRINITY_DN1999_c0_g1~~TRINITY_DN1999_c0_g1_i1.p1  ORF type:complete len:190 (-),score=71.96 TRINITY_DN1999_c0_g1_i1:161-730(-)
MSDNNNNNDNVEGGKKEKIIMELDDNYVELTYDVIDSTNIINKITKEEAGGISLFIGTTRNNFQDKEVVHLEYEAYDKMAMKEMLKVCNTIREEIKDILGIAIVHRLGVVPVKEASVIIAASCPHRKEAMEATSLGINLLKQIVPIWKKERYSDGTSNWKKNSECKGCVSNHNHNNHNNNNHKNDHQHQ